MPVGNLQNSLVNFVNTNRITEKNNFILWFRGQYRVAGLYV